MHRPLTVIAILVVVTSVGSESGSPGNTQRARAPVESSAAKRYGPQWETPAQYGPPVPRQIGFRNRNAKGEWSYNLRTFDVAMQVRTGEPRPEEWLEWWQ